MARMSKLGRSVVAAGATVLVAVASLAGWVYFDPFGAIARLQAVIDPVGPPQSVTWDSGPDAPSAPPGARPPNVVVILADDLGMNDVTAFGGGVAGGRVATPSIDAIAHEGVSFDNGYTGHATCAPSRAALLTGRFPARFGFQFNNTPGFLTKLVLAQAQRSGAVRNAIAPPRFHDENMDAAPSGFATGLPLSEIPLPQILRAAGHRTLGVGKWHLGDTDELRPNARGFDEWLGFTAGAALYLPIDDPNVVNATPRNDATGAAVWALSRDAVYEDGGAPFRVPYYMTDYFGDQAALAIRANRNRPFFLYVAFNAPHTPLQALRADWDALGAIEDADERVYGAMVRALDRNVGKILDELRTHGLAENTLVVFTTDNGAPDVVGMADLNAPYRGWKATFFEGGIHAPFFLRWPARVPAGSRVATPVANVDVFTTAITAAGAELPVDRELDGIDLVGLVEAGGHAPRGRPLFWKAGGHRAVLDDGWKLLVSEPPGVTWLFDLSRDPHERTNVSEAEPAQLARLQSLLDAYERSLPPPLWPILLEKPVRIDADASVPVAPGQEYVYWAN
jgi:arylsulfatase A-like enzyme